MMGHVRKRGKFSWEIRYSLRGERKTATVRGSKRDAERKLRALLDLADRGLAPSKDTCSAWFSTWLATIRHEVSPVTHADYAGTVERILTPAFGDLKLAELDMITIRKNWAELAQRLAPASVHVVHRTLSACLSYALEGGLISSNPCANWRKGRGLPPLRDQEKPALTRSELLMLIEAARPHELFAPVVLGAGLGARRGEVCALKWRHIDVQSGDIRIVEALKELSADNIITGPPKGRRARKVRLPTSYLVLLREWRNLQAQQLLVLGHRVTVDDYVCTDEAGRNMTPERLTKQFGAFGEAMRPFDHVSWSAAYACLAPAPKRRKYQSGPIAARPRDAGTDTECLQPCYP